jgi:hypothetical protein
LTTKLTAKDTVINLGVFVLLFYLTFIIVPYIQTRETYSNAGKISSHFPVAIIENGKPAIVKWPDYENNVTLYKDKLISSPSQETYNLDGSESFTLRQDKQQRFNLKLNEEDYVFWAEYTIANGVVKPISFRFNGVFSVFWGAIVAFTGTPILNWLRMRYLSHH